MDYEKMTREELIRELKSLENSGQPPENLSTIQQNNSALIKETPPKNYPYFFGILSETTVAAVFIYQGTRNIYVNSAASAITGYSRKELLAMKFWEILHPEFQEVVKQRGMARQNQEPVPPNYEVKILTKSGEERWLDFRGSFLEYNGEPAVLGTAFDITNRKISEENLANIRADLEKRVKERTAELSQANVSLHEEIERRLEIEETLQNNEALLRTVMEKVPEGIVVICGEKIVFCNRAMGAIFGYREDEIIGNSPAKFIHPEDIQRAVSRIKELNMDGPEYSSEYRSINKNGEITYVEVLTRKIIYNNKPALLSVVRNMNEFKKAKKALEESERRYRRLFEEAPLMYVISKNQDGIPIIIDCNQLFLKNLDYKREEVINQPLAVFCSEDSRKKMLEGGFERVLSGQFVSEERELLAKDGRIVQTLLHAFPEQNGDGSILGSRAMYVDITERKKAQEKLQNSEQQLRALVENSPDVILELDREMTILFINRTMPEYDINRVLGSNALEYLMPQDIPKYKKAFKETLETGKIVSLEIGTIENRLWLSRMIPIFQDNKVKYIIVIATDITEQKKVEEALRKSGEFYRMLLKAIPDALFRISKDGVYRECIPAEDFQTLIPPDKYVGKNISEILPADLAIKEKEYIRKTLETGEVQSYVYELFLNGTMRDYESRVAISGEDEVLIIVRDVTQAKHAQEELKKHRDELEMLVAKRTEKLNAMNITLREEIQERERTEIKLKQSQEQLRKLSAHIEVAREEEKTRIAREIHDELGQALSVVQMDLSWLEKHFPVSNALLEEKIDAMSNFIDETIRKVQRISQELRPSVLDHLGFAAAIEWQLHEFQKRSEIHCAFSNRCPQLSLDKNRAIILFRVFQETLTNIYRHARANKVKVILKESKGKLFLHIQDDGRGITQQQLYNPNSLGLVGMRERMYHIHGEVDFFARPAKGTKIIFSIPLTE